MSDSDSWDPDAGAYEYVSAADGDGADEGVGEGIASNDNDDNRGGNDVDDDSKLRSFYEEASVQKSHPGLHRDHASSNDSPHDEQASFSQHSALSHAELSRLSEKLLSQTTTGSQNAGYTDEEERQRRKLKRREDRQRGVRVKRPRRPPTEIQIKAQKEYQRFKYKKKTDLSEEVDVGGSMEYMMRQTMNSGSDSKEIRKKMMNVAKHRELHGGEKEIYTDIVDVVDDNGGKVDAKENGIVKRITASNVDHHGVNWNYPNEGYVTMPPTEANKLPYYLYGNTKSKRKLSDIHENDNEDSYSDINDDRGSHSKKRRRKSGHLTIRGSIGSASVASGDTYNSTHHEQSETINGSRTKSHNNNIALMKSSYLYNEPEYRPRFFPLQFHQLKKRMDLHSMMDTSTLGAERMVVAHGRNAKRLWTRMVAGGITNDCSCSDDDGGMGDGSKKREDDESISNVSSSSSSNNTSESEQSYQVSQMYSQMSYGATSVIRMQTADDDAKAFEGKGSNPRPLFRLMEMVHNLPKVSHRNRLLIKVAQELGTNRRLWEEELKYWIDPDDNTADQGSLSEYSIKNYLASIRSKFTPVERWAIKTTFLGVDGYISNGLPSWACDPCMPTHPGVLKHRLHSLRSSFMKRFHRWIGREKRKKNGTNIGVGIGVAMPSAASEDDAMLVNSLQNDAPTSEIAGVQTHHKSDYTDKDMIKDDTSVHKEGGGDDAVKTEYSYNVNSRGIKEKLEGNEEDTPDDMNNKQTTALWASLIDKIQGRSANPPGQDKYAKVIHESGIDLSHVDVALAMFLNELTASKVRLRLRQEVGSNHFQHRHALKLAKENVGHWHNTILSYLDMAESLTQTSEANFYKADDEFPKNAALAQAVMATQSYLANGGGVGCGRGKRRDTFHSAREVKDEYHSSGDESEITNAEGNNDEEEEPTGATQTTSMVYLEKRELRSIQIAAKDISKRGRVTLSNRHLTPFTSIHLTTGIAIIASHLTPMAAESLSKPCHPDASENRTPFDLIRNMLVLINENGSLIPSPQTSVWNSKEKIIDEMLVNAMREAATVFRKCIEEDANDVDHWSWYVATLLGMLCISFPSMSSGIQKNVKVEQQDNEEIRSQLGCFHEVRHNASIALTDFLNFGQMRMCDCPLFHLASMSMLEWEEAILLLHRPQSKASSDLASLHAYHTYNWAIHDCSTPSLSKVQQLCEARILPKDALLCILACSVERSPCERENWVKLVDALERFHFFSRGDKCMHENRVCSNKDQWWGKSRAAEWEDQFFHAPKSADREVKPEFVSTVSSAVDPICQNATQDGSVFLVEEDESLTFPDPLQCMGWMWNPEEKSDLQYDHDIFSHGPFNLKERFVEPQSNRTLDSEVRDRLSGNPSCEALCMKIAVACHLLGPWHPFVCNSVWWLSVKVWQSLQASPKHAEKKCNNYDDGLVWLTMQGLNVSVYLRCRLRRSLEAADARIATCRNVRSNNTIAA